MSLCVLFMSAGIYLALSSHTLITYN